MRGTDLGGEPVRRQPPVVRLQPLLERRLVVFRERGVRPGPPGFLDQIRELPLDERPRRLDPAVEVDRGDQRLVAVGDERVLQASAGLLFPAAENQERAEVDLLPEARQRGRRDDRRLQLRLLPLVVLRELAEQHVGDDEAEHRVAEELHRLVVEDAAAGVLVHARAVRQRVLEQPAVLEAIADAALERLELRAERDDPARAVLVAVAVDDPLGVRGVVGVHRDPAAR